MSKNVKNNEIENKFNIILNNINKKSVSEENMSEIRVNNEGCEVIIKEIFLRMKDNEENKGKYLSSKILCDELKYSKVRVNNVLRKMIREKYLVRKRVGNCYYYKNRE